MQGHSLKAIFSVVVVVTAYTDIDLTETSCVYFCCLNIVVLGMFLFNFLMRLRIVYN